ncbi:MAG: substrate-binding domain-containing protein [Lachnospiraceae bacterium]|nr:substrate-binding domain-containing protein [Lachnospiraceae bacterium]
MKKNFATKIMAAAMTAVVVSMSLVGCGGTAKEPEAPAAETSEPAAEEPTQEAETPAEESAGDSYVIGYAQRGTDAAYTINMMTQNVAYAEENFPDITFQSTDAQNDAAKQASDTEDLIAAGVDLIMISPLTAEGLTDAVQNAMDAGIPVVTMDRMVDCDVTVKVVGDNYGMGVQAADKLAEMLDGKGNIIELCGTSGSSATVDRQGGFEDTLAEKYPDMKVVDWQDCNYMAAPAATYMEDMLQKYGEGEIQAIYAHNDQMAMAAFEVIAAAGRQDEGILICGMDGEEAAFEMVDSGDMAFTIIYPVMAPEGIIAAHNILTGAEQPKEVICESTLVDSSNVKDYLGKGL